MRRTSRLVKWMLAGAALALIICITGTSLAWHYLGETDRWVRLAPQENKIYFTIVGRSPSPFTPDGPFPEWKKLLVVTLKPGIEIPKSGRRLFTSGTDFSTNGKVESGTVLVDVDKQLVEVNVKYTPKYWWETLNGQFPISNRWM
jgi:hypothetical protein